MVEDLEKKSDKFVDVGAQLARQAYERRTPKERAEGLRQLYGGRVSLGSGGTSSFNSGAPGNWTPEKPYSDKEK
jgi:hypothetical protein